MLASEMTILGTQETRNVSQSSVFAQSRLQVPDPLLQRRTCRQNHFLTADWSSSFHFCRIPNRT